MFTRTLPSFFAFSALHLAFLVPTSSEPPPILLIVPAGSELVIVDRARSVVPAARKFLLVGEFERVPLKGGFDVLVDRTLASAPAADVLVLLPGETSRQLEDFVLGRRESAKAILLFQGSPLVKKLGGEGGRGALMVVGKVESIPALLDALSGSTSSESSGTAPTRTLPAASPPTATPTPTASKAVFDRYFSSGSSASRRSPTPR